MKDGFLRVGVATPAVTVANPESNADSCIACARAAAADGVRVLVLPELTLSSYGCSDLFFQKTLLTGCEAALARFARETRDLDLITFIGLPVRAGNRLYNCAAAVSRGEILGVVPKTHIPNYNEFYEARHFAPAPDSTRDVSLAGTVVSFGSKLIFACREMPTLKIACEICEDLWVSVPPSCAHAAAGATVIVNLSASDELVGKADYRRTLLTAHSARNQCAYLYANAGRDESGNDCVYSAHSLIAENGNILAERAPFAPDEITACEIDTDRLSGERAHVHSYLPDLPEGYREIPFSLTPCETPLRTPPCRTPFVPADQPGRSARCALILNIQATALAGRIRRAHAPGCVIGVSGGLDSTLSLLVAVRAFDQIGRDRRAVTGITMPCFGTTARTRSNAEKLMDALGVTARVVDIKAAVAQHFSDIGHDPDQHDVVYENAQARERTQILMDVANADGSLVIGTGDLSELALGWATYNGDHMSMYATNASVPKTLVRYLVSHEADRFEAEGQGKIAALLRDVLATPVSPELLPPKDGEIAQCTEGIVGPYELHDFFLYYTVRHGFSPRKILRLACCAFAGTYDPDTVRGWLRVFVRRFFTQQFKRSCLPDGPKVGSVSLSPRSDWRMPSDADARRWLEETES